MMSKSFLTSIASHSCHFSNARCFASTPSTSSVHAMSATAQQRAQRIKAREEAEVLPKASKVTLQAVLNKNKKVNAVDDLYEMQSVKSAAHEFREKKIKGQIPFDHVGDNSTRSNSSDHNKSNSNKAGAGSTSDTEFTSKNSNWIPLLTAILGIFSLTIFSANKLSAAQADHIQTKENSSIVIMDSETIHTPVPVFSAAPTDSSVIFAVPKIDVESVIAVPARSTTAKFQESLQQQPLWLQRQRSEPRVCPKP